MSRIGRQISHFKFIDPRSVHAVFSKDKRYRYLLSMSYSNTLLDTKREKNAVVILKNPSAADEFMADATIRKVETFIYHRFDDVKMLYILNIFAYRASDSADLNDAFLKGGPMEVIGVENDYVIKQTLAGCDYGIIAWGNRSNIDKDLYEERVYRVKQIIQQFPLQHFFHVSGRMSTKFPLHGLMWGYDYSILPGGKHLELL